MNPILISASLVLFKPDLATVERTLRALQEAGRLAAQHYTLELGLTLVDNSEDDTEYGRIANWLEGARAAAPDWTLQLQRSPGNIGYGRGNNLVIAGARSDYHLVVNPDLFVDADALLEGLRFMEAHADVGLLTPAVFGEDGERHYLCKRNPTLLVMFLRSFSPMWLQKRLEFLIREFEMRDCDYEQPIHPVEYPTGCFMFFRTAPLQKIGGFDPDFFLHYEDADIGRRILRVARSVYVPSVRVVHQWARDTHRSLGAKLGTARSGWLYWVKWGGIFSSKPLAEPKAAEVAVGPPAPAPAGQKVLVTGANGFIGQALCATLSSQGCQVRAAVRKKNGNGQAALPDCWAMGDVDEHTEWAPALAGMDSVVHLAARVHQMRDTVANPLAEFRRVNVDLTLNLARQAAKAGVRRFVFISSVKVNGETTVVGQPFTADDSPAPIDAYGISKFEAEQALVRLAAETGLEVVIVRPVLVYGPGVKANFHEMMRWVLKGVPLPLGGLDNQRSFVAIDNVVDLISVCLRHPQAANQVFLVSDGEDLTVSDLLRRTAAALGRPARLLPVPMFLLRIAGRLFGKEPVIQRLCDTLQVDIGKTQRLLGWTPPLSVDAALWKTAQQLRDEISHA
ncbi:NAD-dependent epimerase/dehydratase family protein [Polaromonas sp. LjRoot131]|uniref:NAD-dependent epimerase/dehydratase family protein n=1 Tax=Polaromonas sp. LjRoot131 TaxID=3342262 RepID=UPI003F5015D6